MYEETYQWTPSTLPAECVASFGGIFSFILLVALPIAIFFTWLTIQLYRRKISKTMRQLSESRPPKAESDLAEFSATPPHHALTLKTLHSGDEIPVTGAGITSSQKLRQTATAYVLAGLAQAITISALTFFLSKTEFLPIRFASTVFLYLWPIVPTLIVTSIGAPRVKWLSLAGYFGLLLTLDFSLNISGIMEVTNFGALLWTWLFWMGPPTVLLWILSNRAWRSVGLMAYLVSAALVGGWLLATQGLACLALSTNNVSLWTQYRWPVLIGAIAITSGLAWWVLRRISHRYAEKKTSDQSLTLSSWWLLITLVEIVIQFDATAGASVSFILGYLLYLWISRSLNARFSTGTPLSLLLLRVFGHRQRSRALLDQLSQRWRFIGPIHLIGAPDVATTNLEPDELIQFWGGQSQNLFVADERNLNHRLKHDDKLPDPDGRFRINEFFCYENTWRDTVKALASTSHAILMDLRGFGPDNRGCEFELGLLIKDVPLEKILLLVDETTHQQSLETVLKKLWVELPASSANRKNEKPELRLFETGGPIRSVLPLLSLLTAEPIKSGQSESGAAAQAESNRST